LFKKVHINLKENKKALHIAFIVLQLVFHYRRKDQSFVTVKKLQDSEERKGLLKVHEMEKHSTIFI